MVGAEAVMDECLSLQIAPADFPPSVHLKEPSWSHHLIVSEVR